MDRKVQISVKALVIGGLCAILLFGGLLWAVNITRTLENVKLAFQVQQNSQNIQALDKALGEVMRRLGEEGKK